MDSALNRESGVQVATGPPMAVKKEIYLIDSKGDKCPLCNLTLASCHLGEFCNSKGCAYVDGMAWLTKKQAEKFQKRGVKFI